jgi:ectoine hydroxylase-related dioxygenase (phytanoyl-CoA dioxygenase family)
MIEGNPRLQLEMFEGAMRLRKVEPVIDISEPFRRAASDACLVGPVTELLGDKVVLFEDKLNFKYPQGGTGFSLHQDYAYWTRFSPRLCTALIYLDQATHENGCIELVPRRHKQGLFPCASQPVDQAAGQLSDLVIEDGALDLSSAVKATGNPGTVLLFNCLVPHCSKPNHTQKSRRAILYTYGPLSENTPYSYTDFEERYQGWLRGHQAASQPTA